jgi:prevent-host-death family protein
LEANVRTVGIRDLKSKASEYLKIARSEGPLVITNHGKPQAALIALEPDEVEDFLILHSPKIKAAVERGLRDVEKGQTYSLEELAAEDEAKYK